MSFVTEYLKAPEKEVLTVQMRIFSAVKRTIPIVFFAALSAYFVHWAVQNMSFPQPLQGEAEKEQTEQQITTQVPPETIPEEIKPSADDELFRLSQNSGQINGGYILSDGVYDSQSFVLAKISPARPDILPDAAKYTVTYTLQDGSTVPYTDYTLRPRMGYISLANETSSAILDENGDLIPIPEGFHLSFASCRDIAGKPVFLDYVTGLYHTVTNGIVEKSDYDPKVHYRGLNFDYPSYYGISDDAECKVVSSARGYGYNVRGGKVSPLYARAYAFSEGLGCAHDARGRLYFFDDSAELVLGGLEGNLFGCGDDISENSLGFYYFDEGLTRVTIRTGTGKNIKEKQALIDKYGKELALPRDFNIKAYSCGSILLEKDGLYGYADSRGRWICEPEYTFARPFFEGLAAVRNANGKMGMIDKNGNYVIQPVFDEITDCSGGIICVYDKDHGWSVIHKLALLPKPEEAIISENSVADAAPIE